MTHPGVAWTGHDGWLRQQKFDSAALQLTYDPAYNTMIAAVDRRGRLDKAITVMAADSPTTVRQWICDAGVIWPTPASRARGSRRTGGCTCGGQVLSPQETIGGRQHRSRSRAGRLVGKEDFKQEDFKQTATNQLWSQPHSMFHSRCLHAELLQNSYRQPRRWRRSPCR